MYDFLEYHKEEGDYEKLNSKYNDKINQLEKIAGEAFLLGGREETRNMLKSLLKDKNKGIYNELKHLIPVYR